MAKVWIGAFVFVAVFVINYVRVKSNFGFQEILGMSVSMYLVLVVLFFAALGTKKIFKEYGAGAGVFVGGLILMLIIWIFNM